MQADLESLTAALLDAARRAGAEQADALAVAGRSVSIDVRGGRLEQADSAEGVDLGLRVLIDGRQACVSSSSTRADTLAEMAERAVAMAKDAPRDPHVGLADPADLAADRDAGRLELEDPAADPDPADLQALAERAEAAAAAVAGVSQVESASASFSRRRLFMAASNGFAGGYGRSGHAVSTIAITGQGTAMERDMAAEGRVFAADLPAPEAIGQLAGDRAVARAGARKAPTGAFPVLFDERISAGLIGHLLAAVNGLAIARGASWLREALDQPVLPTGLDLFEDPHRARRTGSRPFDAEGLATRPRHILRDGRLMGWTLDLATARKLGMTSTASAARGTGSAPAPSVSNVALTQGAASRDDLIRDMGTGLIVTSFLGASINATTGDYSRGAAGFWVENGQIAYAVNETTIAGNLRDMLMRLTPANDARTHLSQVVPSLLVEGLTLAGA
ncbi:TldD/PmbA family protein [Paracoccus sp. p4-l81]|uniref:TldD/PmbA family protein n=1 Tax=Paracoccus sp. p4-l81 TaxID=3342806 RepID=UPI0035B7EBE1